MRGRCDAYGYRDFSDPVAQEQLRDFMDGRAWTHAEGALGLFTQATAWLRRHRVLLPGVTTLARLVSQVRDQAAERMYRTLAEAAASADADLPYRLRDLLTVAKGSGCPGWRCCGGRRRALPGWR